MILKGNQRANGTELAIHLMKDENEHISVRELRGFTANDLMGAFQEIQAISRCTRAKKYLYSLSINPPKNENAKPEQFAEAIERAEEVLGLSGQPRAIVFHTKEGRTHCHVVWSRIDAQKMKAIKLTYPKRKLNGLALELFIQNGWEIPAGFLPGQEADPMNYTFAEYQEAKRGARDPKHLKHHIKTSFTSADGCKAFEVALERGGLFLAQGDRRGFVCVDYEGNIYSLSRWSGVKTKELVERLGEPENFRSVDEVQAMVAERMTPKLEEYVAEVTQSAQEDLHEFEEQKHEMTERHRLGRVNLQQKQDQRWKAETIERANRFSSGIKGLWHRVTGKHSQISKENELAAQRGMQRDSVEQKELTGIQEKHRQQLQRHIESARSDYFEKLDALYIKLADYAQMGTKPETQRQRLQDNKQAQEKTMTQIANWEFDQ